MANGSCACGALTFTADIVGDGLGACHCGTCRKINGGPFIVVDVENLAVADESVVGVFDSSSWADRTFCTKCGTSIAYRLKGTTKAFAGAYLFDPPLELPLKGEVFIDEKPSGYSFAGDTHKMTGPELFAAMQGNG